MASEVEGKLLKAIARAEDGAGTVPAKHAVKLRPPDWHDVCRLGRDAATTLASLQSKLEEKDREIGRLLEDRAHALSRKDETNG